MSRLLVLSVLSGCLGLSSGCAMCCAPLDFNYQSVAGRWMRTNPTSGRVGSVFDEAGAPIEGPTPTSTQSTPPTPAPATTAPPARSVVPRTMGETYLPAEL
jgi:hypothetical protein